MHSLTERIPSPAPAALALEAHSRAPGTGTIPVPPQAKGGLMGTLAATFVLSIEVLVSILRGLFNAAAGRWKRPPANAATKSGWLRRSVRFCARLARLALFLVGLMLLGALVILAIFLLVKSSPQ